jgi:signal transduction histidine kinase
MSIIAIIDLISFFGAFISIGLLISGWSRPFDADVKVMLLSLFSITAFHGLGNVLEWSNITAALDPIEDYMEILGAMIWIFLFYAFLKEFEIADRLNIETVLKSREEELKVSTKGAQNEKSKLDAIIAGIGVGISIQNTDYRIIYQNEAHINLVGNHIGEYCFEGYEKKDHICEGCPVEMAFKNGNVHTTERLNVPTDRGLSHFEITASPVRNNAGDIVSGVEVVRDITARKRSEDELIRLNKELEQILYVTSHDLRSPLVNIEGFSKELERSLQKIMSALEDNAVPSELKETVFPAIQIDIQESLGFIYKSVSKMSTLISGLLELSRLGRLALKKEALDMNTMISDILSNFEFRLQKNGLKPEVSKLPLCIGDAVQINQVFSNLIDNALKYLGPEQNGKITISGTSEANRSIYCIEDSGIGIAPEHQAKIFEIFHQLNPQHVQGEGLGLTIAQRIIEMHHGRIWVESEKNKGSRFYLELPGPDNKMLDNVTNVELN